ncbi:HlyD family efflux transporter periplasmic adaptor subunit [Schlesneria sp.]|uniref:HlyD family efflux transporter periplasmic adaptor subunit n=1 Tax=Schlesneria sp. TaxID=2762018 RepID=UPI002F14DDAA
MSKHAPPSSTGPASVETRRRMEECIDHLAELARGEIDGGQFIAEVLTRLTEVTHSLRTRCWRKSSQNQWEVAGERPQPTTVTKPSSDDEAQLNQAAESRQLSTHASAVSGETTTQTAVRTCCPVVYGGQTVAVLDVLHAAETEDGPTTDLAPFLHAIAEITADFLSQLELRQLRRARSEWQQWDQLNLNLMKSHDLPALAATIVNDGRIVAGCDRLTLMRRRGSRYIAVAVSGADRIEPRANTVHSLEAVASIAARNGHAIWFHLASADANTPDALAQHAKLTGAHSVGLIPIPGPSSRTEASVNSPSPSSRYRPDAILVVEQFDNLADSATWQSRGEHLANRLEPTLLATLEQESIPFARTLRTLQRLPEWLRRPGPLMALLALLAAVGFLTFYPAEFTVTGPAELVPVNRREVFASSSGIVEKLLVSHGEEVTADHPLIILHDPQLALELPRVMGEIEVVRERLKGVLAARLSGGATADAANRARQLASEEEELKERQQSLIRQKELIERQQEALTLRSPIRGRILTWDVATTLAARPVERGQALLTVGDTDGPWMIEMRVADKEFGHIRRAQSQLGPNLAVHFLLPSDPTQTRRGTIRDVAGTTQWDEQHGSYVLVTIDVEPGQVSQPRSGMTAVPRILCGKYPIGYVWLHDLIDTVRLRWML